MTEPRSRIVKCVCACSMLRSYNVRSAPGQRDIDWERVGKLALRLQEQKEIRLQPIYMFFDGIKIMYIIDGQHRYHAYLKCCEMNIHKPLEVLYELGNEKDAGDAYDLHPYGWPFHNLQLKVSVLMINNFSLSVLIIYEVNPI